VSTALQPLHDLGPLLDLARESVQLVAHDRQLTPRLAEAISGAGFARHFVPQRWGGTAGSFESVLAAVAEVGESCASTAWCAALYAAHGRLAAYLPEEGQADLWRETPDVRIAAAVNPPSGEAVPVPGGWLLTGRWALSSGVDHADWILLASCTGERREQRIFAVPRSDFRIKDIWHSNGLRGTGGNSVLVDGVHVPEHRTMLLADLDRREPGSARCHAVPVPMVAALQFAAPALGAARAAHRIWAQATAGRRRASGLLARETAAAQQVLARTSAQIEAAALMLRRCAERADRGEITGLSVAENLRDAAFAVDSCLTATQELLRASGARALTEDDPVQRCWLDVSAVASHAVLDLENAAAVYARAAFAPLPQDA
jgi:two-component flavin-dependent monooxygenase